MVKTSAALLDVVAQKIYITEVLSDKTFIFIFASTGTRHTYGAQTYMQAKYHTHKIKLKN